MKHYRLTNIAPRITPALDPSFRPMVLMQRAFLRDVAAAGAARPLVFALEQADGSVSRYETKVFAEEHPLAAANARYAERLLKFLLWSRGGCTVHVSGPPGLAAHLQEYYATTTTGRFDAQIMGERIYERPFAVRLCAEAPAARNSSQPLGRHWEGCRIGFDLGGSDRKVAAVIDGQCVFSDEVVWDPVRQADPQYHFDGIMDSLRSAAKHLPRVDAIGGSAAGVYVNNRVKVASLFRGVPPEVFQGRVKDIFLELRRHWRDVPFEVVNDGEVTALAGSMSLGQNAVIGIALGTSQAGGYVTEEGNITSWLNELAFVPVDLQAKAAVDEWSGDAGCGVQYFSQNAVGRLLEVAGITLEPDLPLPEKLKRVQDLMHEDDYRARKIYQTIGTYLGYAVAQYAEFYPIRHGLILGRVTSGPGGGILLEEARRVLEVEFPELARAITLHTPDEKEKRHGQAMAAASLPRLEK